MFEELINLIPCLIFVPIILIVLYIISRGKKINNLYDELAIKRNGVVINTICNWPIVKFYHGNFEINTYSQSGSKYRPPYTIIVAKLKCNINQYMFIYNEGFGSRIAKKLGVKDIQVGIDSFDNEVMIKGSDEYFIRSILTYEVQNAILNIVKKHKAKIELRKNKLKVFVEKIVNDDVTYDELIETNLKILDQIAKKGIMY